MKSPIAIAFLGGLMLSAPMLSACAGPQGNPNGMPYANEDGGTIAVKAQTVGAETYDPYAPAAPFEDMRPSGPAINPPPPLTYSTPPAPGPMTPAPGAPNPPR
ncbi:MAG TPA: hypothetical protein VHC40_00100 [Rhizomicrobium sp.]|jgi:hypothetical protein|nr:hypothetical protein [Rhizomicrobium sp.]